MRQTKLQPGSVQIALLAIAFLNSNLPIRGLAQSIAVFDPPSSVRTELNSISENGQWAAGLVHYPNNVTKGIRAQRDGQYKLFDLPSTLPTIVAIDSISDDGQSAVGYGSNNLGSDRAFLWTNSEGSTGHLSLFPISGPDYQSLGRSYLNRDGSQFAVTLYNASPPRLQAARYTPGGGFSLFLSSDSISAASGIFRVTRAGNLAEALGERTEVGSPLSRPTVFKLANLRFFYLDTRRGEVHDRDDSETGTYVGKVYTSATTAYPVRWSIGSAGVVTAELLGSLNGATDGEATSVNSDGTRAVGRTGSVPFIWDRSIGLMNLNTAIVSKFGVTTEGSIFGKVVRMSKDGTQVAGEGTRGQRQVGLWVDLRQRFAATITQGVRVSFPTVLGKTYEIFKSEDLLTWTSTGVVIVGTGAVAEHCFEIKGTKQDYRIVQN